MNATDDRAKSIFLSAAEIAAPEDRRAFVEIQCAGDESLRSEVEELLGHQQALGSFLEAPPAGLAGLEVTVDRSLSERPGSVIGPYKLLQQIGEGGMGVVFMAEQSEPIQRTVALKIIKPGMDTRQVIARFEAERQAVAMMDHPNIAKVLDAGTTNSGRPYFVMELVKGVPITKYCDDKHLPLRDRLELFVHICEAVQHAHQKGIIHRDIKPNNVLVAEYDHQAVPKVIDFGVAKATAQKLTERTMFTEFGQVLGTMEYMSPEQAKLNQLDIDTRSDIYSLGVLLYELLTGSTPFEGKRLHEAAFDEMLRIIREEEPPRPSTRVSTLAAELATTVAGRQRTEPRRLLQALRGDLDWIVMKSLDKDRNRRYETASSLADDVMHYLRDEPVSAVAPSRVYRACKLIRRNKWPVIASTAVFAGLVATIIGMAIGLVSQWRQRAEAQLNMAASLHSRGRYAEAEALYRKGLKSASSTVAEDRQRAARTHLRLARVVYDQGDRIEADRLYRDALAAYRAEFPRDDPNIAHAQIIFALLLRTHQRFDEAEPLFREAYEIYRRSTPANHRAIGESATFLANVLITLGRHEEAVPLSREAIAHHSLAVPHDDMALALARLELGRGLVALGKFPDAESTLLDAERALTKTEHFHVGILAPIVLYTSWDQAEPGKGYDAKARERTSKLIGTFVRLDKPPLAVSEAQQ